MSGRLRPAAQAPGFGPDTLQHTAVHLPGPGPGKAGQIADCLKPERQVNRRATQRIAFGQQGGQWRRVGAGCHQHMGQTRMQGQGGQRPAMRRDVPLTIERAQHVQQSLRLGHRALGRRRQERQIRRGCAPQRQFQRQPGQVRRFDLGRRESHQRAVFAFGPKPIANTGCHPTSPTGALRCFGPGHPFRHQTRHAGSRVEPGPPRLTGIHNDADILNGQRGFGDRGRQHHFAALRLWLDGRALVGKGHRPEQRANRTGIGQEFGQGPCGAADFAFARQKHQQATACVAGFSLGPDHQINQRIAAPRLRAQRRVQPACVDWKAAPLGRHYRGLHQISHRAAIQRCRHRQQDQIVAQGIRHLKAQRQPQIRIQRAFVEFVKDHRANTWKLGI